MRRQLSIGIAIVFFAATAAAQDSVVKERPVYDAPVPARAILARHDLLLTDAQIAKLKALESTQSAALSKATAAFLRAEADLLDASRNDDLAVRRLALEKRAKVAIDAEMGRLQADKDSRAVLTAEQRAKLASETLEPGSGRGDVAVWESIVGPPPLTRVVRFVPPLDSTELRLSVTPIYADIYLDGDKIGSGRRFLKVAVGMHLLLYHATGCTDVTVSIAVAKGPPVVVPAQALVCTDRDLGLEMPASSKAATGGRALCALRLELSNRYVPRRDQVIEAYGTKPTAHSRRSQLFLAQKEEGRSLTDRPS